MMIISSILMRSWPLVLPLKSNLWLNSNLWLKAVCPEAAHHPAALLLFFCSSFTMLNLTAAPPAYGVQLSSGLKFGDRHIVILQANQHNILSTLFVGITNNTSGSLKGTVPLFHPEATREVQVVEGLQESHIVVSEAKGGFAVEKSFPPGSHIVAVRFVVPSSGSTRQTLRYRTTVDLHQIAFLKQKRQGMTFDFHTAGFNTEIPTTLHGASFQGMVNEKMIPAGSLLTVELSSLPEGRSRYYLLGAAFALLLLLGSAAALFYAKNTAGKIGT